MQQQISNLKTINNKLLQKYVAEKTNSKWEGVMAALALIIIVLVPLGIIANIKIDLGWPVIISFWICSSVFAMCGIFNTHPISKGSINVTPVNMLRQTLLSYCKRNRITTAICLPFFLGVFIWLAFALRHAINYQFLSFEIANDNSDIAFWITISIGVICTLAALISTYYSTPKEINELVAEIDEFNVNG